MEQAELAMKDLNEMVAIAPGEGQSYLDRAIILGNWAGSQRKRRQIRSDLQMAVKLDPKNPMARFLDGVDQLKPPGSPTADVVSLCRAEFEIAIASDPGFVPAYAFRMICDQLLLDEESLKKHVEEFDRTFARIAVEKRDRMKGGVGRIANVIRTRMRLPATQILFDTACEDLKDAEHADAEEKFVEVLRRLEDPLIVSREGIDARSLRELKSKTQYNLGCVYALRRELDRALQALEAGFRIDPDLAAHAMEDQDLANLADDLRLKALVKRYRKE
jgi:tetratricopeptide (TPR) repeat protein